MNQTEFEKTYLGYCRECNGWGVIKSINPNTRFEECECIKEGRCPRCSQEGLGTYDICCANCGWQRDSADRGLPGSLIV
ncbi:hypothetical protein DP44_1600 [Burkholderia pseudomallei]|nr:hypothetical protein DP44_1600 [Burkholderia pseudomallei]